MPRPGFAVSALLALASPVFAGAVTSPYVIDFFPEGEEINNTLQLLFFGPGNGPNEGVGYEITNVNLDIEFTTAGDFQAENLLIQLTANSGDGFIAVSGADLGWSGQGTFSESIDFSNLNGVIGPGIWTFDLMSVDPVIKDPFPIFAYSGTFSDDTRFEVTLIPSPTSAALLAPGAMFAARRRRR